MYVKLKKSLHWRLQAILLSWRDFSGQLEKWEFILNPYNNWVENKMMNGSRCTILWHVDELKILHTDSTVVDRVIEMLNKRYGKETPMTATGGTFHNYLGMTWDFLYRRKSIINMVDYVETTLEDAPAERSGEAVTSASKHIFQINKESIALDQEKSNTFHITTAKLLFLAKRGRPDIQ